MVSKLIDQNRSVLKFIDFSLNDSKLADEIIMHEGVTAVYKSNVDLFFCVLGAQNENEVCNTTSKKKI